MFRIREEASIFVENLKGDQYPVHLIPTSIWCIRTDLKRVFFIFIFLPLLDGSYLKRVLLIYLFFILKHLFKVAPSKILLDDLDAPNEPN